MLTNNISITFRGKEIRNPLARVIIMPLAIVLVPLAYTVGAVICVGSVPLHFVLRLAGRRGFVTKFLTESGTSWSYKPSFSGFGKIKIEGNRRT